MNFFVIYIAAFVQVALLNFQARNAAQGKAGLAIGISMILGTLQVLIVRSYVEDFLYGIPFIIGGSLGAGFGIHIHKKIWKRQ